MLVSQDKVVSVTYNLRINGNSEIIETVEETSPLTFIFGRGYLLPRFEENLANLTTGQKFEFVLNAPDAYGEYFLESVMDLPLSIFMNNGKPREDLLHIGNIVPIRDASGRRLDGKILEIGESTVKLDFNHPMAGKDLHFTGEVVEIREATEEELNPSGCGCGGCDSGSCSPGSCGDGDCGDGNCNC